MSIERKRNSYGQTHEPEFISKNLTNKYLIESFKKEFDRVLTNY